MLDFDKIRVIINDWDPIGLINLNPIADEYDPEIKEVLELLEVKQDTESLAKGIQTVFLKWFGEDFDRPFSECLTIAQRILQLNNE